MIKTDVYCGFCINATVTDDLTPDNDLSYMTIGVADPDKRIMFKSGDRDGTYINVEQIKDGEWRTIANYIPKYCPNCGRKLIENEKILERIKRRQRG